MVFIKKNNKKRKLNHLLDDATVQNSFIELDHTGKECINYL